MKRTLMVGVGMLSLRYSYDPEDFRDLPSSMRAEISELVAQNGFQSATLMSVALRCPQCRFFSSFPSVRLVHGSGEFQPRHSCRKCGVYLVEFDPEDIESLPCPRCGSLSLETEANLCWD